MFGSKQTRNDRCIGHDFDRCMLRYWLTMRRSARSDRCPTHTAAKIYVPRPCPERVVISHRAPLAVLIESMYTRAQLNVDVFTKFKSKHTEKER